MVTRIDKKRKRKTFKITFTKFRRFSAKVAGKNEHWVWTNS
jgi:hypothetical protein